MTAENIRHPPVKVSHAELSAAGGTSPHVRKCPECDEGLLMVRRHQESLGVINLDRCLLCGQAFIYTDAFIGGEPVMDVTRSS